MSKKDKLIERLRTVPKDFTYEELVSLLKYLGFEEVKSGKTSGSAVKFKNYKTNRIIYLHKPHPSNIVKKYILIYVIEELEKGGYLSEK